MKPFSILPLTLAFGLSLAAQAPSRPEAPKVHRPAFERLAHRLGLSETQKTQIQAIRQKHAEGLKFQHLAAKEAHQALRQALRQAMDDPAISMEQLKELHAAASDRRFDALMERRAMRQEFWAVLTPEQQGQAELLRAEMRGRFHPRFRIP